MREIKFQNKAASKAFKKLPEAIKAEMVSRMEAYAKGLPDSDMVSLSASVGKGAFEFRINGSPAFRVIVHLKENDAIWVIHAFEKTTNDVDHKQMNTAKCRHKALLAELKSSQKPKAKK